MDYKFADYFTSEAMDFFNSVNVPPVEKIRFLYSVYGRDRYGDESDRYIQYLKPKLEELIRNLPILPPPPPPPRPTSSVNESCPTRSNIGQIRPSNSSIIYDTPSIPSPSPQEVSPISRPTNVFNTYEVPSHSRPMPPPVSPKPSHLSKRTTQVYNILVLGSTGVGKSTFINALANYLTYDNFDDAVRNPRILIPAQFTESRRNEITNQYDEYRVIVVPNMASETTDDVETRMKNENLTSGDSATQYPRSYLFSTGTNQKIIRIIDTPGIMDTRGLEKDKENLKRIMDVVSAYSEIHAICIMIKAYESKLTTQFRFCIDQLLVHLQKDAAKNIRFCFTHCSLSNFNPGDSIPTLQRYLSELKEEKGIEINMKESVLLDFSTKDFRFFCFENSPFLYFCGNRQGISYSQEQIGDYKRAWNKSKSTLTRFLDQIATLPPHDTAKTLSINNTRTAIMALSRPLAMSQKALLYNASQMQQKQAEIEQLRAEGTLLRNQMLTFSEIVPVKQDLEYPTTVCTNKKFAKIERLKSGITYTNYTKYCHSECYLTGVPVEMYPNEMLKNCIIFLKSPDKCSNCGFSWKEHMHLNYILTFKEQENLKLRLEMNLNANITRQGEQLIAELEQKRKAYLEEVKKIQSMCAIFAVFLKANSLLDYTDSFEDYCNFLISEEENKPEKDKSNEHLKAMKKQKEEYEHLVQEIKDAPKDANVSLERVNQLLEELKRTPFHGELLKEIEAIQVKAVKEFQEKKGKLVAIVQPTRQAVQTSPISPVPEDPIKLPETPTNQSPIQKFKNIFRGNK